jgi:hypothetical protein
LVGVLAGAFAAGAGAGVVGVVAPGAGVVAPVGDGATALPLAAAAVIW